MITRIPSNILHRIALYVLTTAKDNSRSWFIHIKNLCAKYQLPHPITLLNTPMSKDSFKKLAKAKVVNYWEQLLRSEAKDLPSLTYFNPNYMSLTKPHPIWTTCGNNTYDICKAIVQVRMLSGRFRTERLLRHFTDNKDGVCQICSSNSVGSIEHILLGCPSLNIFRLKLLRTLDQQDYYESSKSFIKKTISGGSALAVQLLLDCSSIPEVISMRQTFGEIILEDLFKFSRSWCYTINRERLRLLGRLK